MFLRSCGPRCAKVHLLPVFDLTQVCRQTPDQCVAIASMHALQPPHWPDCSNNHGSLLHCAIHHASLHPGTMLARPRSVPVNELLAAPACVPQCMALYSNMLGCSLSISRIHPAECVTCFAGSLRCTPWQLWAREGPMGAGLPSFLHSGGGCLEPSILQPAMLRQRDMFVGHAFLACTLTQTWVRVLPELTRTHV